MFRFLAVPVACLALTGLSLSGLAPTGLAVAQDRPGPVALATPDSVRPDTALDSLALRHPEPQAAQTTSALRSPADLPRDVLTGDGLPKEALRSSARPWCAQERRVGTGAGFCLIN